jgi:alanine racemase
MPVSTWVEVDLDRFTSNLRVLRSAVGGERGLLLVVKADAYGHGAVEIAAVAEAEGVAMLGVATLHEGIQLRQSGSRLPIVVLSPLLTSEIEDALDHALDPTVADLEFARALSAAAGAADRAVRVHVEVDTGMGRSGVAARQAEDFLARLVELPYLRLGSVFTHFPDADAPDLAFAREQVSCFEALRAALAARGIRLPRVHLANSAATVNLPEARGDWIRVGLLAYGHRPPRCDARIEIRPVMAFKSRLVQIREFPAETPISYGRTYVTRRPTRVGVVAVGYGHGYSWLLSNRGAMLVGGRRVPILGRVTMDLTMVDLEAAPQARVGDEALLFGEQGGEALGLDEVARWSGTLPYEVMCTIGKRVTRIYVRDGRPVKLTSLLGESREWARRAVEHFRLRAEAVAAARHG